MKALVPAGPLREHLGTIPVEVELVAEPDAEVEFAIVGAEQVRELPRLFARLPGLRVVQSLNAGIEWILPHVPPGVILCNASGAHDPPVAEWVVGMLIALRRRVPEFLELQRRGEWDRNVNDVSATGTSPLSPIDDLEGSTVVVLGYGSIGRAVAARLTPFGVHVVGVSRSGPDAERPERLRELLPGADAVVVLLPLSNETLGTVDARFLALMKPGALLLNAGRGAVVDTGALLDALHAGRIRAALDVTDPEPLPPGHRLWSAPNVVITPHVAGAVARWRPRAYRLAGEQLRRYAAREPLLNVRAGPAAA